MEWLVTYELELGGALVPPGGGQDFCVQWDFAAAMDDPGWTAEILKGALKGKTYKCRLANLDAQVGPRGGSSERGGRSARAA